MPEWVGPGQVLPHNGVESNLREFTISTERFANDAEETRIKRVRATALYAMRNVVLGTRVATGRARGNWQDSEGEPPEGYDWDTKDAAGAEGNRDTVSELTASLAAVSGSEMIWLHNGLPYIGFLEDLDAMVSGTVEAVRTWLRS